MPVLVIGLSHRTSPVAMRERFALAEDSVPPILARLRADGLAEEGVILSTCNRVELYAAALKTEGPAPSRLRQFLIETCSYEG